MALELQLGRYTLHTEIASGGMATVYVGRLNGVVGFGRTVAIKRLHPHLAKDPEFVTMLLDEARLAARIQHPNVVPTLDVVATDGELFLVLEYVKGEALSTLVRAAMKANAVIPLSIVGSIIVGMLSGLDAAHGARDEHGAPLNIVHRDVSPQNVIVGADGVARVLDFGVAKAETRLSSTREGHLKGKIPYMAPEQLAGEATRQTDIYAAGVVLWEALTCRRLFSADSELRIIAMIQKGDIAPPSTHNPAVPKEIDAIVMKALARNPEERYATAHEMAQALDSAIDAASPMRVSEWMKVLVGPSLDAKTKLVADIESGVSKISKPQVLDALRTPGVLDSKPPAALTPSSAPSAPSAPSAAPSGPITKEFASVSSVAKAAPSAPRRIGVLSIAVAAGAGLCLAIASALGVFSHPAAPSNSAGNAANAPIPADSVTSATTTASAQAMVPSAKPVNAGSSSSANGATSGTNGSAHTTNVPGKKPVPSASNHPSNDIDRLLEFR